MQPAVYLITTAALLAMPGPTNALLAAAGAASGFRRSSILLVAVLAGYAVSVAVLRTLVGPAAAAVPAFAIGLRIAIVLYLAWLAVRLWRDAAGGREAAAPADFQRLFAATLLNPKGVVIAFALLPASAGFAELAPRLAALAALVFLSGSLWIAAGAAMRRGMRDTFSMRLLRRACAVAMAAFAGLVGGQALALI